jgi:urease subunit alpha
LTPRLIPSALAGGITTLITAGWEEPLWRWLQTVEAFEQLPVNIGLQATARTDDPGATERLIVEMGCPGLKVHEDFAAYPEVIAATLDLCEIHDIQLCLHTDGLHESAELEETIAAIGGRTMHAYHVEGAGGGHVPDLIKLVREPHVICSSTNPAIPWGPSSAREHLMMTILVHGLSPDLPEHVEMVQERIHPATMAAEGPLHELGAIQIIASDSQGMGRIGETVRKTWQLAHAMKIWRGTEEGDGWPSDFKRRNATGALAAEPVAAGDDNDRALRYLAKYTIEPAIAHGLSQHVGTLAPGRLADVVLWSPVSFGVRPALVIKGGLPAWGPLGEGNAAVTLAEPVRYGAHWGGVGAVAAMNSALFVSRAGADQGVAARTGTRRQVIPVQGCRQLTRDALWANREALPIEVDVRDGTVFLDGRVLATAPVTSVPLSRRYVLA